jgi:hypothetical protein
MARPRSLGKQLKHAWNAFVSDRQDATIANNNSFSRYYGRSGQQAGSVRLRHAQDKTILTAIYTRLAIDAAGVDFRHVRKDDNGQYKEDIDSNLNQCLTLEANIDQSALALFLDVYLSLFDNGFLAIVPTDTTINPSLSGGWDVLKLRVGEITDFKPQHVMVSVYDEQVGERKTIPLAKEQVAIVYNPFYAVMNDGASVLQRLVRKLSILDTVDEASAKGKLDLLIQLPYQIRGKSKEDQATRRQETLEDQMANSPLGIGYIDATEKVIQLNRPVENNLMSQIEYLVGLLYSQLGLTPEIMNGTADEKAMLNYMNRTITPLTKAVRLAMVRTFLTKTARTQGQDIMTFWDQWQFIPLSEMANLVNSLLRNEVITANEIRPKIGFKPHADPNADKLSNANMPGGNNAALDASGNPIPDTGVAGDAGAAPDPNEGLFNDLNSILDNASADLGVKF